MKIVDCIGDVCPLPVIKTKRALTEVDCDLEIRVDNGISLENVQKYVYTQGRDAVCVTRDGYFAIIISADAKVSTQKVSRNDTDSIVVIACDIMGGTDEELGRRLLKAFVFVLTQLDVLPHAVVLYNRGVLLAVEGSSVLEDLQMLAALGVQILSCGLCIDYFGCEDKLAVGEITNMYAIVEMMQNGNVIRP